MSLRDQQTWDKIDAEISEYVASLNKLGVNLTWETVKESFSPENYEDISKFGWSVTEGIRNLCVQGEAEKSAAGAQIKAVRYAQGTPEFKLDGTTLLVTTDLGKTNNAAGIRDSLTEWLLDHLN